MLNIDLNNDSLKSVFTKVVEALQNIENNPKGFYENTVLPIVADRHEGMIYLRIKSQEIFNYSIALTLENGTVVATDANLGAIIDLR